MLGLGGFESAFHPHLGNPLHFLLAQPETERWFRHEKRILAYQCIAEREGIIRLIIHKHTINTGNGHDR